ncbi:hypothetical protein Syun_005619 [Stephania yunnanensis]|uniref:Bromo domain-containing protein n=1 Tax=Stephania yunnanensis TaxID=152371 RepID=A0AAP0L6J9_9MAGN
MRTQQISVGPSRHVPSVAWWLKGQERPYSGGDGREKKLKLVLRLPSNQQNHQDSQFLNWDLYGSDSNADDGGGGSGGGDGAPKKKRKINAAARHGKVGFRIITVVVSLDKQYYQLIICSVCDGFLQLQLQGEERQQDSTLKTTVTNIGTSIDDGPDGPTLTPLPDKMLLVFILDRVQKKDTYGVFSEPVDPEEIPDYHEIVKHPMDFSTVRKKLMMTLIPKDVFLICSNAMQYNAPDTIYFRQARTMQELAKKNFENLRQDSDYEPEPELKVARRGRPPTKNLKKPLGKPLPERAGSEFFSDAALPTGGEHTGCSNSYNLRKGPLSDRFGSNDASGRTSRYSEASGSSLSEHKFVRNDDYPGSTLKGYSWKFGKRQFVIDGSRRNTYKLSHQSTSGQDPSLFTTFYAENKQLMAVGLHTELGYARSLARFAASLGPVAWKIASKKIERALPSGVKFGPGWVGENDSPDSQPPSSMASPSQMVPPQPSPLPNILSSSSSSAAAPMASPLVSSMVSSDVNKLAEEKHPNFPVLDSSRNRNLPMPNSMWPRPSFQVNQNPICNPTVNGMSGGFSANLASQMAKAVCTWPSGNNGSEASMHTQRFDMVSRNNFVHSVPAKPSESLQNIKVSGTLNGVISSTSPRATIVTPGPGSCIDHQPSWQGLPQSLLADSAPPDLNLIFHSPGSPHSGARVDSHPDLVLQL